MKHLNKLFFVLAALFTTSMVMAQEQVKTTNHNFKHANPESITNELNNAKLGKADYTGWFSPVDAAAAPGTGNFQNFVSFLTPDSTVKFVSDDGTDFFYNWHSIGMVFDPTDDNFELVDDGMKQGRWDNITIDSVAFSYLYVRHVDSMTVGATKVHVVDTLILQYFKRPHLRLGQFTNQQGATEIFAQAQNLNTATLAYNTSAHTIKIPLTKDDSTIVTPNGWRSKTMTQAVPSSVGSMISYPGTNFNNLFGMNISFKSMLTPAFGDTMEARNGATVTNPLNYFGHSLYTNDGTKVIQTDAYNNSWWTTSEQRYGNVMNGWNSNVPGNAYFTHRYWRGFFHTTIHEPGNVKNVNGNGYGMGAAYPNPSQGSFSVNFVLAQSENVNITVTDLLGKVVAQSTNDFYSAGDNTATINVEGVKPGVYVYTLRAGDYTASNKVTIQ